MLLDVLGKVRRLDPAMLGKLSFLVALAILVRLAADFFYYLYLYVPPISRGDFLFEMWRIAPLIEANDTLSVFERVFRLFGGHIVAYKRVLQITNYIFFDYSGNFVRWEALSVYVLALISLIWFSVRVFGLSLMAGAVLVVGGVQLCSPVPYEVITWSDAVTPYLSCAIVLLFLGPRIGEILAKDEPRSIREWLFVALFAFLVIIGSGIGWAILPALAVAYVTGRGYLDAVFERIRLRSVLIVGGSIVVLALATYCFALWFTDVFSQRYHLNDVNLALKQAISRPRDFFVYFLALLPSPFMIRPIETAWMHGLVVFCYWLILIIAASHFRQLKALTLPVLVTSFALGGAFLVAVGRWEIASSKGILTAPTYYSLFVFPLYMGLVPITWEVLRRLSILPWLASISALLVCTVIAASEFSRATIIADKEVRSLSEWHVKARDGSRDWNLYDLARLTGDAGWAQLGLFQILSDMKRWGKYPELTRDFINDPGAFARNHGLSAQRLAGTTTRLGNDGACNVLFGSGALLGSSPDKRAQWHYQETPVNFVRFFGYARHPTKCNKKVDYVFAVDGKGTVICVSRTARPRHWDWPVELHRVAISGSEFVFDFSCPLGTEDTAAKRGPFDVYAMFDGNLARIDTREPQSLLQK